MLEVLRQSSAAAAIYTSPALHIGFINKGMRTIWELPQDTNYAQFRDLLPQDGLQELACLLSDVWNSARPFRLYNFPVSFTRRGSTEYRYMDWDVQPIVNADGITQAMIHTLQEVVHNAGTASKSYQISDQTSFDTKLDKWSHALSHDLRNPLSVAKLGIQYMQSHANMKAEEHTKWTKMVIDALYDVEKLITNTVEVSRNQSTGESQPSHIQHIFNSIVQCTPNYDLEKNAIEIKTLIPLAGKEDVLHRIFSLTMQSVLQSDVRDIALPIVVDSIQTDDLVQYSIAYTSSCAVKEFVGYYTVEQLVMESGGTITIEHKNEVTNTILINFPIY